MDNEDFNFVIARPWKKGESSLCVYAYGTEVFHGSMDYARSMRDFINGRCDGKDKGKYKIYKIESKPID